MTNQLRRRLAPLYLIDGQRAGYVMPEVMSREFEREVIQEYLSVPIWQVLSARK